MITIFIDNKPYQVKEGQNLLRACLSLGFDLPYFCWHPALHSVGACRQCAVKLFKDEKDARGRIVMSCMTPVADGMRLSVDDAEAKAFRKSVAEWLMLNHPHDCPVCDEGGECHLQDMTVMTGQNCRRTRFPKRTHRNQFLGPFINHEMNRCIQCYRCVRFYRGIAGGRDLNVFSAHDHVYFGRHGDGALESEFSGNLVEVCPTGVFTDKTLRDHYTRKWDLQTAPSLCVHCGVGCNTIAGERYGSLRRILNRFNPEVNGWFLCDRGRFGYEFVNSEQRVRKIVVRSRDEGAAESSCEAALGRISDMLGRARGVIGIGSPRASLESNYSLRLLVGPDNFYSGISSREQNVLSRIIEILRSGPASTPSLADVQQADAVLVLGEDVPNTAPLLALSLRQAARNKQFEIAAGMKLPLWDDNAVRHAGQDAKSPVFIVTPYPTRLDDIAAKTMRLQPREIAAFGSAIGHRIDQAADDGAGLSPELRELAGEIASVLQNSSRPLIVSGTGCMSEAVVAAAANISLALRAAGKEVQLAYAVAECDSFGAGLLGGKPLDEAFEAMRDEIADTVVIMENDLYRRADRGTVDAFLGKAKNIIVIDHIMHRTAEQADVLLPAATFAESSGTLVNSEGRAQRFYQVFVPKGDMQAGWKWMHDILWARKEAAKCAGLATLDRVIDELAKDVPLLAPVRDIAPPAAFRMNGQKVPRQPHRCSGRTSLLADRTMHEPKPPEDSDSPLSFSMEGTEQQPPAPLLTRYWSPGWNSVQAVNALQPGEERRAEEFGKRLIEPKPDAEPAYFEIEYGKEQAAAPEHSVFRSEELSSLSPPIEERCRKLQNRK